MANKVIDLGAQVQIYIAEDMPRVGVFDKALVVCTSAYGGVIDNIALFVDGDNTGLPYWYGLYSDFDWPAAASASALKTRIDAMLIGGPVNTSPRHFDGGRASEVYTIEQIIDGGNA